MKKLFDKVTTLTYNIDLVFYGFDLLFVKNNLFWDKRFTKYFFDNFVPTEHLHYDSLAH